MGEFMGQGALTGPRARVVLARPEHDFISDCVGVGLYGLSRRGGGAVIMDPDGAQVSPKCPLHPRSGPRIQWLATALTDDTQYRGTGSGAIVVMKQLYDGRVADRSLQLDYGLGRRFTTRH
jgi:hypothetical protein